MEEVEEEYLVKAKTKSFASTAEGSADEYGGRRRRRVRTREQKSTAEHTQVSYKSFEQCIESIMHTKRSAGGGYAEPPSPTRALQMELLNDNFYKQVSMEQNRFYMRKL